MERFSRTRFVVIEGKGANLATLSKVAQGLDEALENGPR